MKSKLKLIITAVLMISYSHLFAERYTLFGYIRDKISGESLIGVSVTVKGKEGVGTITDVDGNYSIVCSAQDVLVFSYVGYATQEIAVKNQKQLKNIWAKIIMLYLVKAI